MPAIYFEVTHVGKCQYLHFRETDKINYFLLHIVELRGNLIESIRKQVNSDLSHYLVCMYMYEDTLVHYAYFMV